MKHLKHINEYNSNSEYYQEINDDDYTKETILNKSEPFSKKEISQLSSYGSMQVEITKDTNSINLTLKGSTILNHLMINIDKNSDEWFYCRSFHTMKKIGSDLNTFRGLTYQNEWKYYKCDQFEGLIKLLNDIKHIKHINEFSGWKMDSNEYYQKISEEDYYQYTNFENRHKSEPFLKEEIDKLSLYDKHRSPDHGEGTPHSHCAIVILGRGNLIDIYKESDEWYYCRRCHSGMTLIDYYKCDQFEGLIKLLNDIKPLKTNEGISIKSEYYIPVNSNEWVKEVMNLGIEGKAIDFTNIEKSNLKKITDNNIKFSTNSSFGTIPVPMAILENARYYNIKNLIVYKDNDEWFYVYIRLFENLYHYKCDQLEGLIECIKDIKNSGLNESVSNKSEYYQEITDEEMSHMRNLAIMDDFTEKENKIICKTFHELNYHIDYENIEKYPGTPGPRDPEYGVNCEFITLRQLGGENKYGGNIYKVNDEWFYVSYCDYYPSIVIKNYKCDQFEGLLECIKDNFKKIDINIPTKKI